jgi:beta-galactosidase
MVPHTGPDSRTFREVVELGRELAEHPNLVGSKVEAKVAIVMDWPNWWALELDSHPSADVTMRDALLSHYTPLFEAGVTCDVVPSTGDLSGYRLVVIPNLYLTTAQAARNLTDYARQGGHLVVSFFTGIVDECDRAYLGGYLGPLCEVVGARVQEWLPLQEHDSLKVQLSDALGGGTCEATVWSEVVTPSTADVVASFQDGDLAGAPAVLRNTFGAGTTWYVATRLDRAGMREVVRASLAEAGVAPVLAGLPAAVEAVASVSDDGTSAIILLNHSPEHVYVSLPDSTSVALGAGGVAILDASSFEERP